MDIIEKAIEIATVAHNKQLRKGTNIPYIAHPFGVALILSRAGLCDELIAAALLHDTVEDTEVTLEDIRKDFGDKIASIVKGCSEHDKALSWEERKTQTVEYLKNAPLEVKIVSCADKLHNIRSTARDYEKVGDEVWGRFKRGKDEQEWYYKNLVLSLCSGTYDEKSQSIFDDFKYEVEKVFGEI